MKKDEVIANLQAQVDDLKRQVAGKDRDLDDMSHELGERRKTSAWLGVRLASAEEQLQVAQLTIKLRDDQIDDLRAQLREANKTIETMKEQDRDARQLRSRLKKSREENRRLMDDLNKLRREQFAS